MGLRQFLFGVKQMQVKKWYQGLSKKPRVALAIIGFMLMMRAIQYSIIQPIITAIFSFCLEKSGYRILYNNNILEFFLTIEGLAILVVMIVLLSAISALEFAILTDYIMQVRTDEHPSMLKAIKNPPISKRHMNPLSIIGYFIYTIVFLPIARLGYASSLLSSFKIPNFITGEIAKNNFGPVLIALIYGGIAVLFFISIYTIPIMFIQEINFFQSLRQSIHFVRKHFKTFLQLVLVYLVIVALLQWVPLQFLEGRSVQELFRQLFFDNTFGSWTSILSLIIWLVAFFFHMLLVPVALFVIIQNYLKEEAIIDQSMRQNISMSRVISLYKWIVQKKWLRRTLLVLLFLSTSIMIVYSFLDAEDLHEPILVGHRGSVAGVENSLEAIQGAIDAKADYAEVDILLSADGVPMVTHDDSMQRLANENVAIHDLTAAEISELTLHQNGHTGKISTLDEVLQYTQGKIELAIELKTHGKEEKNLVDEVAKLMEKYDVLESSIVLSLDYNLVDEMNTKHPETYSGLCIFGTLGYLDPIILRDMNIDFVFIEEWMATEENLLSFRRAWLPAYIWTANETENMAGYLQAGALGLVTDYPAAGREEIDIFNDNSQRVYLKDEKEWRKEVNPE